MNNRKAIFIGIVSFVCIGIFIFTYKLYKNFSEINTAMQAITNSIPLYFQEVGETIYIKKKVWGLLGDHSRIYISDREDLYNNDSNDIIFDNSVLYYKTIHPDSLLIFMPSMSFSEEKFSEEKSGNIKIKITKFQASSNREYEDNYKEKGLIKIDAYNVIK